jgi:hypothetical protein
MWLLKLASLHKVENFCRSRAARSSLVVVLPLDPPTANRGRENPLR